MSNKASSYPASSNPAPLHRFGGVLSSMSELPISVMGDIFAVEGVGTVRSLPGWPKGPPIEIYMVGSPTFVHSSKLLIPGAQSYTFSPGDSCRLLSLGDGVWRMFGISRADGIPFIPSGMSLFPSPQGRLTLTSGTAETNTDVASTNATVLYYTQRDGDMLPLYDAATGRWVPRKFTEPSLSLSGATSGTVFDVFSYDAGGTVALETLAWTNDTTRATAITKQDGIDVKSGDATRRLLGTFRTTGTTGQTEDSQAKRYLSNRYNDVPRPMKVNDPTATWPYSAATWRQANNNTANQIDMVCCVPRPVQAIAAGCTTSTVTASVATGIGVDSVPAASAAVMAQQASVASGGVSTNSICYYAGTPGAGRHYLTWLEYGQGSGTQTWLGTVAPTVLSGISGMVSC